MDTATADTSFVPDTCTLPTVERPLRVTEFADLFATTVLAVVRNSPTSLRIVMHGDRATETTARELAARETECCSFFTFAFERADVHQVAALALTITVPTAHVAVLDGLQELARTSSPAEEPAGLRSGALAGAAGVNQQTLRYYERRGLLSTPRRTPGGHRVYPDSAVTVIRIIKAAQRLGFTLDEIAGLIATGRGHARSDAALHERAMVKLGEIEARIADLVTIRETLRSTLDAGCHDLHTCVDSTDCPIPFSTLVDSP